MWQSMFLNCNKVVNSNIKWGGFLRHRKMFDKIEENNIQLCIDFATAFCIKICMQIKKMKILCLPCFLLDIDWFSCVFGIISGIFMLLQDFFEFSLARFSQFQYELILFLIFLIAELFLWIFFFYNFKI